MTDAPLASLLPATPPAVLLLEDGTRFQGNLIGAPGETLGEIVFNTSVAGYQEILTDPSYCGQIVLMTTPEMGNYGTNAEDEESTKPYLSGFVVKRLSETPSSWRSSLSLPDFLARHGITGIEGVDTRAITRHIRTQGAMKAGITSDLSNLDAFLKKVKAQPALDEQDLVSKVTCASPYTLTHLESTAFPVSPEARLKRLVILDFGIKQNILRMFRHYVDELVVMPAHSKKTDILAVQPDAVFFSNGPGDPVVLKDTVELAKALIAEEMPVFGICLGHQILALACGARVEKMPFGHHGGNHPVKDLETGVITITSQNHGYAVVPSSLRADEMVMTHLNLNDHTVEGFRHLKKNVFSVQFHPEACPGPHDSFYLFERFLKQVSPNKTLQLI